MVFLILTVVTLPSADGQKWAKYVNRGSASSVDVIHNINTRKNEWVTFLGALRL